MTALGPTTAGDLLEHRGNAQVNEDLKEVREGARWLSVGTADAKVLKQECAWELGGGCRGETKEGRCRQTERRPKRDRRQVLQASHAITRTWLLFLNFSLRKISNIHK